MVGTLSCGAAFAQSSSAASGATNAPAAAPGLSLGSPIGFGASWGDVGIGVGGQTLDDSNSDDVDGSAALVVGLGDADKYVGLEAVVDVISLREDFGDDGAFALKLHTNLPGGAAFAVGVENIGRWGRAEGGRSSVYAVGTKFFNLSSMPLAVNLGIGDNRFNDAGDTGANVFGGLALYVHPQFSLIADWIGSSLNLGVSALPFRSIPLVLTLGALNVTGEDVGSGNQAIDDTEFGGALGYTFRF
ncbi:hypothetical protein [Solimonas sp. K1W22B-7]|uniref:hypothetical protein n=1 Tax=Solimonas sp. K1W22B-7 TaxID=2303331 RepID=UPI001968B8D8|nr:hypothetical protein [Solimonas sp. K1W22B-7]